MPARLSRANPLDLWSAVADGTSGPPPREYTRDPRVFPTVNGAFPPCQWGQPLPTPRVTTW